MAIPPQFLEELRSRVSLVDIVGRKVKLVRKGTEFWGPCPFHNEKTASFSVSDQKGFYHCFGCGAHGDVINFEMNANGLSFLEAVDKLAHIAGMEVPRSSPKEQEKEKRRASVYEVLEETCRFFEEKLYSAAGRDGLAYLRRRGLSDEIIRRFRLGFAPGGNALKALMGRQGVPEEVLRGAGILTFPTDGRSSYDYFRDRVMFPIMDKKGRVIAFGGRVMDNGEPKYLNSPETDVFSKGDILYAIYQSAPQAREKQEIIVVEGYMDVISLHAAGIERAVAPLGTALTERQIPELWKYAPEPILCFDGDKAGQRAAVRAADRVLPLLKAGHSLRFITLPDDLDPDEYVKERGRESFESFLKENSRPLSKQLWRQLSEGRPLDTPERKAALEKDIRDMLEKIRDASVQNFYRQEFKSALWEATNPFRRKTEKKPFRKKTPRRGLRREIEELSVYHPAIVPEREETRMMLTYLILYPESASAFLEDLADWKPSEESLNAFMEELLSVLAESPEVSSEALKGRLRADGYDSALDALSSEIEVLSRRKPDFHEIEADMAHRIRLARRKALQSEMKNLAARIAESGEDEARALWEQYQKLYSEQAALA